LLAAITEYPAPTAGALPSGIASGIVSAPGGNLWFTEPGVNKIGTISTAGIAKDFPIPSANSDPQGITFGPDGNLWFTQPVTNQIGRITTSGTVTEFAIPTTASNPQGITDGPDGNIWFTEAATGKLGIVNIATGTITDFKLSTPGGQPTGITSGPDGNIWFTLPATNQIGMVNPSTLADEEFPINTAGMLPQGSRPQNITVGPDGNLWFTEAGAALIGTISPTTHTVTQHPVPSAGGVTEGITAGSDGNVWFTEPGTSLVGRITPAFAVTEFRTPTTPSQPWAITTGPNGNIWFTETGAGNIATLALGRVISLTAIPATSPVNVATLLTVASFTSAAVNPQTSDFTASINWGDGTPASAATITAASGGTFTVSATKIYASAGTYQATITINDAGTLTSVNTTITVANGATGESIASTEGKPFTGLVATFNDPATTGDLSQYAASIKWGDGTVTTGVITLVQGTTTFNVTGTHTYGEEGTYPLTVTIAGPSGRMFVANGQAVVADASLDAVGTTALATVGTIFSGTVATFTDQNPKPASGDFSATIVWGDGHTSAGTIVPPTAPSTIYSVMGTNTYSTSAMFPVQVTVFDVGGMSSMASSTITAAYPATGDVITPPPVEGQPFNAQVASFSDPLTTGQVGQYSASINWGDGTMPTNGTITFAGGTNFNVAGNHTYARAGPHVVTTTITGPNGRIFVAFGQAVVLDAALSASGAPFSPVVGVRFTGVVATFSDANPNGVVADYLATINWGDGHISSGTISQPTSGATGYFTVTGSNTYSTAGPFMVTVQITDVGGSTVTTAPFSIAVANGTGAISGFLVAPSGFTGNITNVNRPTFQGTASKFALVQLYAQGFGSSAGLSVYLGQTLAGPDGSWSLTAPKLADGVYTVSASVTSEAGFPTAPVQILTQADPLIIDTVAPRVAGMRFNPHTGIITVVISDVGAGLYAPSLMDPANYVLEPKRTLTGKNAGATSLAPAISGFYSGALSATLQFQTSLSPGQYLFQINSGGIVDEADNPLDGEFTGRLPSGNGRSGGNFIVTLTVPHERIRKPKHHPHGARLPARH
jgi:streptogramin lyase